MDVTTAAFLIFLGSQEPCYTGGFSVLGIGVTWFGYCHTIGTGGVRSSTDCRDSEEHHILPAKDRAELDGFLLNNWLGPACPRFGERKATISVLDVKAGKWLVFEQAEVIKTVEEKRGTGKYTARALKERDAKR